MNTVYALTMIITAMASGQSVEITSKRPYELSQCNQAGFEMTWQLMRAARQQGFNIGVTHRCGKLR